MLETLLGATKTESAKPENDISKLIDESVEIGLKAVGLPDTPHNRVIVLSGMYKKASEEASVSTLCRGFVRRSRTR